MNLERTFDLCCSIRSPLSIWRLSILLENNFILLKSGCEVLKRIDNYRIFCFPICILLEKSVHLEKNEIKKVFS